MEANTLNVETTMESVIHAACKLPYCKIDREAFLTKQLTNRITDDQLAIALADGTMNANIPMFIIDELADASILLETTRVSSISTAAGIPGGWAMLGTIPADLAQYYAHILRIAQKLAYLYGYKELDLNDATENTLMIFLGVMSGVKAANAALAKFAIANAGKISAKIVAKPLTKIAAYNVAKKVLAYVNIKLTRTTLGNAVSKSIPILGGVICGGITLTTFLPMSKTLKKQLSKLTHMTPTDLEKESANADIILDDFISAPIVDVIASNVADDTSPEEPTIPTQINNEHQD